MNPMKTTICLLAVLMAGTFLFRPLAQPAQAQSADRSAPIRQGTMLWPAPVHPQARLVTAYPISRGVALIFQEPTGTVHVVHIDVVSPSTDGYTVLTFSPPVKR